MPLLMMLLWILLSGRITGEVLVIGLAVVGLIYLFMLRALGWSPKKDVWLLKAVPMLLVYLLNLLREIAAAALRVALLALRPRQKPAPVLVEFHSGLDRPALNVLLANSITLTPGTVTVERQGDWFLVHALRPEYAEDIGESSFVRLLRRFPA